ncbi:peptide chain release factor-like protein [bacterium]|nr:peptide chain release factor-like protein [bacterium]
MVELNCDRRHSTPRHGRDDNGVSCDVSHPAALPIAELLRQCSEIRTRRSGPGGQHRNKVETAVGLAHLPTRVTAEASERRSQAENRSVAVARLRLKLAVEHREPAAGAPSPLWQSRCRGGRLTIAATHADYPSLVAEALDQLAAATGDLGTAAVLLGVTPSQLAKLLAKAPAAWTAFSRLRGAHGRPPLARP